MIAYQIGLKLMEAKKNGNPLQNTRIIIASWDGEESGLRGARAFCKAHSKELHQIPTQVFNMDCLYNIDNLFFLSSDINQTVKLSADLALKCSNIAKKIGYNTTIRPIPLLTGGTDAGEFGKIGVEATTLLAIAMPWDKESRNAVYHTLKDDITALDPQAIQAALEIIWKLIHQEDKL
jgi:Zn-dependent M28 family amino/carboxypeptidase